MKIAAAYIRVSTDDQVEYSPESQRKALYAYAKSHDMLIPEEFVFSDEGISGRSTKRPAFQRMIGTAKHKPAPFEVILVWKFSRFARNREDSIVYKSMLRKQCGIEVISISEQLGEDKTSILIEALLGAMDEYYSINLAEEVVRGMSEKARRGGTLGRLAYGYRSEQGRVVIDEETADVVRRIYREFDSGAPIKRIAADLNSRGLLTQNGKAWEGRVIEYILRNPFYIGCTHWTPEKVRGKHAETISEQTIVTEHTHPAIIDRELFDRCQERIAENKRKYIYKEHPTHGKPFALKGLVRCSACGATLTPSGGGGVQCHMYSKGACKQSHFIMIPKLDKIAIAQMEEDFDKRVFIAAVDRDKEKDTTETETLRKGLAKLEHQLRRVKEAYAAGVDTLEEYRENKTRIQSQIDSLHKRIEASAAPEITQKMIDDATNVFLATLELYKSDVPDALKNDALKSMVHHMTFDSKLKTLSISYRF
jgi:DNA invertase Pin-like site-specific DNA recombinase